MQTKVARVGVKVIDINNNFEVNSFPLSGKFAIQRPS